MRIEPFYSIMVIQHYYHQTKMAIIRPIPQPHYAIMTQKIVPHIKKSIFLFDIKIYDI